MRERVWNSGISEIPEFQTLSLIEGAAADRIFRSFSDPVLLFWHQDFSGATVGIQAFI
jgi:hypothetical protein